MIFDRDQPLKSGVVSNNLKFPPVQKTSMNVSTKYNS
jgi:hypothetical protein